MRYLLILLFAFLAVVPFTFNAHANDSEVLPISEVDAGVLLRSGRPDPRSMDELKRNGIRTIIDLEDKMNAVRIEEAAAKKAGIGFISSPMHWDEAPSQEQINDLLEVIQDPDRQPVLVHCREGRDRTGVLVALYRIVADHWTPEKAHQEMLDMGFHRDLNVLDNFFIRESKLF